MIKLQLSRDYQVVSHSKTNYFEPISAKSGKTATYSTHEPALTGTDALDISATSSAWRDVPVF